MTYDPASQVTAILHQLGASGPTINHAAYTYNGVGNCTSLTDGRENKLGSDLELCIYDWLHSCHPEPVQR